MPMRRTIGSSLACLVTSACAIAETEESRSAGRRIGAQASPRQQMHATVPRMPIAARCTRPGVASLEKRPGMAWWVAGPPSGEIVDTETAILLLHPQLFCPVGERVVGFNMKTIRTFAKTILLSALMSTAAVAQQDPGVRGGPPGAGGPLHGLDPMETAYFAAALNRFLQVDGVADGLGPRFNLDSCGGCHAQPAPGGTSPSTNPQIAAATTNGASNTIPPFIAQNGPVRETRFLSDGGVHVLFTITGRSDAPGCNIGQPDYSDPTAYIFRIPTPLFGLGLVENTPDQNLIDDANAQGDLRQSLHISGSFNYGSDGTITRFGWKAQNKSLLLFSGEAYNVELGVTNELFPNEREDDPNCQFNGLPEDTTNLTNNNQSNSLGSNFVSDIVNFAAFTRLSAPPVPIPDTPSILNGRQLFNSVGCAACHIPQHTTAASSFTGQSNVTYSIYSDVQLHDMGGKLADGITQGYASASQFRTAPLWGVGQRIFFLHDGRTTDLLQAIEAHAGPGSEANNVIATFNNLPAGQQQAILDFLRGL